MTRQEATELAAAIERRVHELAAQRAKLLTVQPSQPQEVDGQFWQLNADAPNGVQYDE